MDEVAIGGFEVAIIVIADAGFAFGTAGIGGTVEGDSRWGVFGFEDVTVGLGLAVDFPSGIELKVVVDFVVEVVEAVAGFVGGPAKELVAVTGRIGCRLGGFGAFLDGFFLRRSGTAVVQVVDNLTGLWRFGAASFFFNAGS